MTPSQADLIIKLLRTVQIPIAAAKEALELEAALLKIKIGAVVCKPVKVSKNITKKLEVVDNARTANTS